MVATVSTILRAVAVSPVRRSLGSVSARVPTEIPPTPPAALVEKEDSAQVPAEVPAAGTFAPAAGLALPAAVVAALPIPTPVAIHPMPTPTAVAGDEQLAAARQEGFDEGQREALEEARGQWREQDARINALAASFELARQTVIAQAEDGMVALVFEAVCNILGATAANQEAVHSVVQQLLAVLPDASNARVHLHPADAALFEQAMLDAPDMLASTMTIVPDATLVLGGCVVEAPGATLSARLDWQLEQLRTLLLTTRAGKRETF